jgi:hypothetical protein
MQVSHAKTPDRSLVLRFFLCQIDGRRLRKYEDEGASAFVQRLMQQGFVPYGRRKRLTWLNTLG